MKTTKILFSLVLIALVHVQCSKDNGDEPMIEITSPPVADFDALATTIRIGTRVQFVNGSINATSYSMDISRRNPRYQYRSRASNTISERRKL